MIFSVWTDDGRDLYKGGSWPMARAALDAAVLADESCPHLTSFSEPKPQSEEES